MWRVKNCASLQTAIFSCTLIHQAWADHLHAGRPEQNVKMKVYKLFKEMSHCVKRLLGTEIKHNYNKIMDWQFKMQLGLPHSFILYLSVTTIAPYQFLGIYMYCKIRIYFLLSQMSWISLLWENMSYFMRRN